MEQLLRVVWGATLVWALSSSSSSLVNGLVFLQQPQHQPFRHGNGGSWLVTTAQRNQPCQYHPSHGSLVLAASSSSYSNANVNSSKDALLDDVKTRLVTLCRSSSSSSSSSSSGKPERSKVTSLVKELEDLAQQWGIGQASSWTGFINGEWELLYSPQDVTRSSPFFWAFRKAFPDTAERIYQITDSIPSPLKDVGPAFQIIDWNANSQTGRFTSKIKVATLGSMATSIMTTRATIVGAEGLDGLRLQIETTKPEDSSIVKTWLGPLGAVVNENAPPFPSGAALEQVRPGSSQVVLRTTFCDEGLRISRDGDRYDDIYVWRRREFASFDFL